MSAVREGPVPDAAGLPARPGLASGPGTGQRRTKVALVYKTFGNLRAWQLLLGHRKPESTVRYLGIGVDDALALSEQIEI